MFDIFIKLTINFSFFQIYEILSDENREKIVCDNRQNSKFCSDRKSLEFELIMASENKTEPMEVDNCDQGGEEEGLTCNICNEEGDLDWRDWTEQKVDLKCFNCLWRGIKVVCAECLERMECPNCGKGTLNGLDYVDSIPGETEIDRMDSLAYRAGTVQDYQEILREQARVLPLVTNKLLYQYNLPFNLVEKVFQYLIISLKHFNL